MKPRTSPPKPLLAVAELWADFTKAMAIYPEANVRVGKSLDAFQQALMESSSAGHADSKGHIRVIFTGSQVLLGDHLHTPRPSTNLTWLRTRVERGALAGVGFLPDVEREKLVAFTKRLLGNHMRIGSDSEFTSLWPERYNGIDLIQRRFAGGFKGESKVAAPAVDDKPIRSWGEGGAGFLEDESPEGLLAKSLWETPDVASRVWLIEQIHEANRKALNMDGPESISARTQQDVDRLREELMEELKDDVAPELSIDGKRLVRRIVQHMGSRLMTAEDTARRVAISVMENLEDRIVWNDQANELDDALGENTLGTLIASVSRQLFMRVDGAQASLGGNHFQRWSKQDKTEHDPKKVGHAGDDQITDDVASFMSELDKLPKERVKPISGVEVDIRAEQIGVLLHYLVSAEDSEKATHLCNALNPLLDGLGPEERSVLRQYVDYYWYDASRSDQGEEADERPLPEEQILAQDRLFRLFVRTERTRLLRELGVLSPRVVIESFPKNFITYVDSLDFAKPKERDEFTSVVKAVGADRLLAAEQLLTLGDGLLSGDRPAGILSLDVPDAAPLVSMLVRADGPKYLPGALKFLKRHDSRAVLRSVLNVIDTDAAWSPDWCRAALQPNPTEAQMALMSRVSTLSLCNLVREAKGNERLHHRRLQAIHLLASHDASLATPTLKALLAWGKFPAFWNRESKEIRMAAKYALQTLAASNPTSE